MLARKSMLVIGAAGSLAVSFAAVCLGWTVYVDMRLCRLRATDVGICEVFGQLLVQYAGDHNNKLPDAHHWEDALRPYWDHGRGRFSEELPVPPSLKLEHRLAMNISCSGRNLNDLTSKDTILYETISDHPNTYGVPSRLPDFHSATLRYQLWLCGDGYALQSGRGCSEPYYMGGPLVSKFDHK